MLFGSVVATTLVIVVTAQVNKKMGFILIVLLVWQSPLTLTWAHFILIAFQVALDTSYWTWLNHLAIWGSLILFFVLQFFYNYVIFGDYIGSLATVSFQRCYIDIINTQFETFQAMSDASFWFTCLLTTVVLLLPVVAWRFYRSDVHPTLADKVRLLQRHSKIKPKEEFRPFSGRRSR